jgi:hypothetical protein
MTLAAYQIRYMMAATLLEMSSWSQQRIDLAHWAFCPWKVLVLLATLPCNAFYLHYSGPKRIMRHLEGIPFVFPATCLLARGGADSLIQEKVLLFGQSAGAVLTWILSSLPQSPKLISAASFESGAGRTLGTRDQYQSFGQSYASALGSNVTDVRTTFSSTCYHFHLQQLPRLLAFAPRQHSR